MQAPIRVASEYHTSQPKSTPLLVVARICAATHKIRFTLVFAMTLLFLMQLFFSDWSPQAEQPRIHQ
jgi:hypothetical protein